MNRWIWWLLLVIAFSAIIIGFVIRYRNTPQDIEPVRGKYSIGIVTWIGYAPLYIAQEKGFFKEENIDIEIKIMDGSGEREAAFTAGELDYFPSTPDSFVILASNNITGKIIMALDESSGADGIVAKKQIVKVSDLKGKTVGFQSGITSHFFLLYLLNKEGLSVKDIQQQNLGAGDAGTAFLAGKLDAAVTWEPWLTDAQKIPNGHVLITSANTPGLLADVIMVSNKTYDNHPKDVSAFMRAWFRAVSYLKEHEAECLPIIANAFKLKPEEVKEMLPKDKFYTLEDSKRYLGTSKNPGQFSEIFNSAASLYKQNKVIERVPQPEPLVNTSLLEQLKSETK